MCALRPARGQVEGDAARVARNLGWPALPPHLRPADLRRPELKAATVPRSSRGRSRWSEQKGFLFCGSRPPRQPRDPEVEVCVGSPWVSACTSWERKAGWSPKSGDFRRCVGSVQVERLWGAARRKGWQYIVTVALKTAISRAEERGMK